MRPVRHGERRLAAAVGLGPVTMPPSVEAERSANESISAVEVTTGAEALDAAFAV